MNILKIFQTPLGSENWVESSIPNTAAQLNGYRSLIVFSPEEDDSIIYRLEITQHIVDKVITLSDYLDALSTSQFDIGPAKLKESYVYAYDLHPADGWKKQRAKLGWHPDADVLDTQKDTVLITRNKTNGFELGQRRLFSMGGFLHCTNLSRHGVYLQGAERTLDGKFDTIGIWDFANVGEVNCIRFKRKNVIAITSDYIDYYVGQDLGDSTWLSVIAGRLTTIRHRIKPIGQYSIRIPLTDLQKVRLFCNLWESFNETLNLTVPETGSLRTSDVLSEENIKDLLEDALSFLVEVKVSGLSINKVGIRNNRNHTVTMDQPFPLINSQGRHPEFRRIYIGSDTSYRLHTHIHRKRQHELWFETLPEFIGLTRNPSKMTQQVIVSQLVMKHNSVMIE